MYRFPQNDGRRIRLASCAGQTAQLDKRASLSLLSLSLLLIFVMIGGVMIWVSQGAAYAQTIPLAGAAQAKISGALQDELAAAAGPVDILVILREQPDAAALAAAATVENNGGPEARRVAKLAQVYTGLTRTAQRSQAELRAWLDAQGIAYHPFYLVNMIMVQGDLALADTLAARPDVARLAANPRIALPQPPADPAPPVRPAAGDPAAPMVPYGLDYTRAPQVWAQGYRGQGIVVAGQDTGVQWDHPALRSRYRGWEGGTVDHTYDWFNAWAAQGYFDVCYPADVPCDDYGHGTHTVGTMVGADASVIYGMAPDATWIACRNMRFGLGTLATYIGCFEFFLAPYPQDGDPFSDGQPDLAPHIINNSWGCPPDEGCDTGSLRQVVETVRAAGQLVVASAGNYGPACSSVRDPIAIYDASFTVGAHAANGIIAGFSSVGPVTRDGSNRLKPDLAAPGVGVLSTYVNSDTNTLSGTSMAAPHVAGAAALLWSAVPDLVGDPGLTEQVLIKSATPVIDSYCTGSTKPVSPNPVYGYGRLDVAAALELAQRPWRVAVEVTDLAGQPVVGATVVWQDIETGYTLDALTPADGIVRFMPVFDGRYTLRVRAGAKEVSVPGIDLTESSRRGDARGTAFQVRYLAQPQNAPELPLRYFFPWLPVS